ncbi:hypothetical protein TWF481_010988 [Arthrobotrys musiformis]|uniref:Uncharacterized protein n=1 Tax=Arthrobotrys musiformis TaxID=47236 RepID=A0AAV9VX98_9PEZI
MFTSKVFKDNYPHAEAFLYFDTEDNNTANDVWTPHAYENDDLPMDPRLTGGPWHVDSADNAICRDELALSHSQHRVETLNLQTPENIELGRYSSFEPDRYNGGFTGAPRPTLDREQLSTARTWELLDFDFDSGNGPSALEASGTDYSVAFDEGRYPYEEIGILNRAHGSADSNLGLPAAIFDYVQDDSSPDRQSSEASAVSSYSQDGSALGVRLEGY